MSASGAKGRPFVELAALGKNDPWRYLASLSLIVAVGLGLQRLGFVALDAWGVSGALLLVIDPARAAVEPSLANRVIGFAIAMWSFAAFLIGTLVAVPLVHGRSWRSLVHAGNKFNWTGFRVSLFFAVALPIVSLFLAMLSEGTAPDVVFEARTFFLFGAAIVALLPVQVLAEEVFFRGYVMQGVAAFTGNLWLRLLVPAALFAGIHVFNREVIDGGLWVMATYVVLAVYFGILVLRGNGLEYAIGMHLGNNLYVALIAAPAESSLDTPAILRNESAEWGPLMPAALALVCLMHFILTFSWTASRKRRSKRR